MRIGFPSSNQITLSLALFTVASTILTLAALAFMLDIRYNHSPSLPTGLYVRSPRGNLVEICPPGAWGALSASRGYRDAGRCEDGAMPLLKPIAAIAGDHVRLSEAGVAVNGRLLANSAPRAMDSAGRKLDHWPYGDYVVGAGELWVVSTYNARSFDSRYFGPIQTCAVLSRRKPLVTL